MMRKQLVLLATLLLSLAFVSQALGQQKRLKTDANVFGHVVSGGEHLPMVTITVKGTTIGTATDRTGHYRLLNLPEGQHTLVATCLGYRTQTAVIKVVANESQEVNFDMPEDLLNVDAVVVTGDKEGMLRREASTIVNTISPKLMLATTSRTVSEGLPFVPGVRMENNCQNCGFNQVRLNGMEGPYSQILIDGRPIFSGLLGVYGMELIPSNIIERIEVQRGGASSLYGSNAVAGTVNLILQDPMVNSFEAGSSISFTGLGMPAGKIDGKSVSIPSTPDYTVSFNSSNVTADNRTGLAVYGNYRHRTPFDYNGDGFSELPQLKNVTLGARLFQRLGERGKLAFNYFHINEDRRGGNKFDNPEHHADIAEALRHHVDVASANYTQLFRTNDELSVNASLQHVYRNSFYGGMGSNDDVDGVSEALSQYGVSKDWTYNFGTQYTAHFGSMHTLLGGVDITGENLVDMKPEFSVFGAELEKGKAVLTVANEAELKTADQNVMTVGAYAQYNVKFSIVSLTAGIRLDHYSISNNSGKNTKEDGSQSAFVPVPRVSALVNILPDLQMRASYSMGYRAPQLYDEDLHVDVSGATQIRRQIDPDLIRETSHSGMLSFDYNHQFDNFALGILAEGFYTRLQNAFINETIEGPSGDKVFERTNYKPGAFIAGLNLEANFAPSSKLAFKLGGTFQKSQYLGTDEEIGDLNDGQKDFLRSPNLYGFFLTNWKIWKGLSLDVNFNLTGPMLVKYEADDYEMLEAAEAKDAAKEFGTKLVGKWEYATNDDGTPKMVMDDDGNLHHDGGFAIRRSSTFFDMGFKLNYEFTFKGANLMVYAGMKNIFNSYQKDFDLGSARSSSYVYGPMTPRTCFIGIKIGNIF